MSSSAFAFSSDEETATSMEVFYDGKQSVMLPKALMHVESLRSLLSSDVWNRLSEEERTSLQPYLPPQTDTQSTSQTIQKLITEDNFYFGNPIDRFEQQLKAGSYSAEGTAKRKKEQHRVKKAHEMLVRQHHNMMVLGLLAFRKSVMEIPRPEPAHETRQRNSKKDQDQYLFADDFDSDSTMPTPTRKRKPPAKKNKAPTVEGEETLVGGEGEFAAPTPKKRVKGGKGSGKKRGKKEGELEGDADGGEKAEGAEGAESVADTTPAVDLDPLCDRNEITPGEISFIALRNALLRSDNLTASVERLAVALTVSTSDVSAMLQFLTRGSHAVVKQTAQDPPMWMWIGTPSETTDAAIQAREHQYRRENQLPPKTFVKRTAVEEFQVQESFRYSLNEAFVYVLDGVRCVVAPVKRAVGRARDHPLLRPDRPSSVSILSVVRDAAARMKDSVGSRADVVSLIHASQYVIDGVDDGKLHPVVSGAMDRLHTEQDACVKYDSEKKLWNYRHNARNPSDLDILGQVKRRGKLDDDADSPGPS